MLRIHLGKNTRIFSLAPALTQAAQRQGKRVILLVPAQYTLETEQGLMDALHTDGFFDVDVMSPAKLRDSIFEEEGMSALTRIDEQGKRMAAVSVLKSSEKSLHYYASGIGLGGLSGQLSRLFGDFKQVGLDPADVFDYAEKLEDRNPSKAKWLDISELYSAYNSLMFDRFVDGEDVTRDLVSRICASENLRDTRVIALHFDFLTAEIRSILSALGKAAESVDVLMLCDEEDIAFEPVWESLIQFKEELYALSVPCDMIKERCPAHPIPPIRALEEGFLSPGSGEGDKPAPEGHVFLRAAPTPYAECHRAAEEICRLHDTGVPYGDIQVLYLNESDYAFPLGRVLCAYQIPHNLTGKTKASALPPAAFLLNALTCAAEEYPLDELTDLARSGYFPISNEDCDLLVSYLQAWGCFGKRFGELFQWGEEGARAEEIRLVMYEPLSRLREGLMQAASCDQMLDALLDFLEETGIWAKTNKLLESGLVAFDPARGAQIKQSWKCIMSLFDQMHDLLGQTRISLDELEIMLRTGLDSTELSAIPQQACAVSCGPIGKEALKNAPYVFVLGMNDEPGAPPPWILSGDELQNANIAFNRTLHLDEGSSARLKMLEIYKAICSPRKRLYLSHALARPDGSALRNSLALDRICQILDLPEEGGATDPLLTRLPRKFDVAMEGMAEHLRRGLSDMGLTAGETKKWQNAWRYMCQNRPAEAEMLVSALNHEEQQEEVLPGEMARQLFGEDLFSVSRLESFAGCPFRHFLEEGIGASLPQTFALPPIDKGNFYHAGMKLFADTIARDLPEWPNITKEQCDQFCDALAVEMSDLLSALSNHSPRSLHRINQMRADFRRAAWMFTSQSRRSSFKTQSAEVGFGPGCEIPALSIRSSRGNDYSLKGRIDRIDLYHGAQQGEKNYLCTTDYKSSNHLIDAAEIKCGKQMQLLIYLSAASAMENRRQGGQPFLPAGAFYSRVDDPIVAAPKDHNAENAITKDLALTGITLQDEELIDKLDSGKETGILQKAYNRGKLEGTTAVRLVSSPHQLTALMEQVKTTAADLADRIKEGEIAQTPVKTGKRSPCTSCDWADACRRRGILSCVKPKNAGQLSFDDLLRELDNPSPDDNEQPLQ